MKKFIIGFIVGALMFGIIPVMAEGELVVTPNPFHVLINGEVAQVEGYNINGYTYLKLADFGKAGLTVKFNETKGQIEITSKEESVIITPKPGEGDDYVVERYKENGYEVIVEDGVKYILARDIWEKHKDKYDFVVAPESSVNNRAMEIIDKTTQEKLLYIPHNQVYILKGRTYYTYDYFMDFILPIIEPEGN